MVGAGAGCGPKPASGRLDSTPGLSRDARGGERGGERDGERDDRDQG